MIGTAEPTATPDPCTPLLDGMRLTISLAEQERTVSLNVEGLLPEDKPIVLLNGRSPNHSSEIELTLANPVGPDGRYQDLFHLGENDIVNWSGQLIHQRGAICFEFTFPLTEPVVLETTAVPTPSQLGQPVAIADEITAGDWSPDGRFLVIEAINSDGGETLFIQPVSEP